MIFPRVIQKNEAVVMRLAEGGIALALSRVPVTTPVRRVSGVPGITGMAEAAAGKRLAHHAIDIRVDRTGLSWSP
ncbi:hypothetical protein [Pandoraea communis]|uniref:hypothetical protein n=1 Tax=Pandoraea communis TaxID=2508297 RepID=UPI00123F2040|nr:hypothetical protein [Pandoraea communis]MDM8356274.1 hypothetical protein [Pandoraea communis]